MPLLFGLISGQQLPAEWELCLTGPCQCNYDANDVICEDVTIDEIFLWQYFPQNLNRVVLTNNDINKFPPNFFVTKRLENLVELEIRENPLTDLEARDFLTVPHLQILRIIESKFVEIPGDLLMHLQSLKRLWLTHNNLLTSLPDSLLYGLKDVTHVHIRNNPLIESVPKRFFWGPANIQHIDFDDNHALSSDGIPFDVSHSSGTVRYFRIRQSPKVTVVKNTWFKNMNSADNVDLRFYNSSIQAIERGAFDGVPNVDHINLDYNDLSVEGIPDDLFDYIADVDRPVRINLANNPRLTTLPPACNVDGVVCTGI